MKVFAALRRLRERIAVPLFHRCPPPPAQRLAVLARIGPHNTWEQRTCPTCGRVSHWRRDSAREPFALWTTALNGIPIRDDMSHRALAE